MPSSVSAEGLRLPCGSTICTVYRVDLKKQHLELVDRHRTGLRFRSLGVLKKWGESHNKKLIFATNGGIFSPSYWPLGLFIKDGKEIIPLNTKSGKGNFYLQPNGVFYVKNNAAEIISTAAFRSSDEISLASQSGPLLVEKGSINPRFDKLSENKTTRSGVGTKSQSEVLFALSDEPINFYDFAVFFRDTLGCQSALYLDGYISKMLVPELSRNDEGGNFASMFVIFEDMPTKANE